MRPIHISYLLIGIFFILGSCSDKELLKIDNRFPEFVPGELILGIEPEVSMERVFEMMNEQEVPVDQMSGFFHYSALPNDSIGYVINFLNDKPYLNKGGFTGGSAFVSKTVHKITVTEFFFEMDLAAQEDWYGTMDILELEDMQTNKSVLINVEPGTEKQWIESFLKLPEVRYAEMNGYANLVLHRSQ